MEIRALERWDYNQVIDVLQQFACETGVRELIDNHDIPQVLRMLVLCQQGGSSWVAEDAGLITGILLSYREPDVWRRSYLRMRELAWFVRRDYRNTTAAARLFRAYQRGCESLMQQGVIRSYTISRLAITPEIDFESRGFQPIETTYQRGE